MASKCRYVSGDVNAVPVLADADYPVEKGDLIFEHPATGAGRPASALTTCGTEALNQLAFAEYFLGVALESNGLQVGETTFRANRGFSKTFLVGQGGKYEFDCPSQKFKTGQPVGIYATTLALSNQKVDALAGSATPSQGIGVACPSVAALENDVSMDRVIVDIQARKPLGTTPVAGTYSGTSGQ
jgi:hypothetical protein